MEAKAKFLNADEMQVEITFTATLREWKDVQDTTMATIGLATFATSLGEIINKIEQGYGSEEG